MSALTSPPATRLRRPSWTDTRLLAGVAMIAAAVVAGAVVVGGADRSARVWALRRDLPAGTTLQRSDVTSRRVRLFGPDRSRYVDAGRGDPAGRVLLRDVGVGELLPASALGDGGTALRVVGLPLTRAHALGGDVRRGDVVDVIATRKTPGGGFTTSAVVRGVRVVGVSKPSSGFAAGRNDFVVLVEVTPREAMPLAAAVESSELDLVLVVPGADGDGEVGAAPYVTGTAP